MPPRVNKVQSKNNQLITSSTPFDPDADILSRIRTIGFDPGEGIKILIYGRSGSGKTTLWSTFPGEILSVLCSGGLKPGELRSVDTKENRRKIKEVVPKDPQEMATLLEYLSGNHPFQTVVLDHCSGYQDLVLQTILGLQKIPVQKSFGMATREQFGQATSMCKEVFRSLLNLSCNVVFIAQERNFGDKSEGEAEVFQPAVGAGLMPQLTIWLNQAVDYIGQTIIRKRMRRTMVTLVEGQEPTEMIEELPGVDYCLRTQAHPVVTTKFRVPKGQTLPDYIVDPSYEKIISLIRGGK